MYQISSELPEFFFWTHCTSLESCKLASTGRRGCVTVMSRRRPTAGRACSHLDTMHFLSADGCCRCRCNTYSDADIRLNHHRCQRSEVTRIFRRHLSPADFCPQTLPFESPLFPICIMYDIRPPLATAINHNLAKAFFLNRHIQWNYVILLL